MAVKGGFFNSSNADRKYDAEDMNEFFDGLINEGVFDTLAGRLLVSATTGLQIAVASGRAWFLKSWLTNTADLFLTLSAADLTYDRIDIIALDFDKTSLVRENSIIVVEGTPAGTPTAPALIDDSDHLQVALAHISVEANETVIQAADITNKVGTVDCPWVTAVADHVSIDDLLVQWRAQFDTWMVGIEADLDAIDTGDVLTELAAMRQRPQHRRNFLINGDFQVAQRDTGAVTDWTGGNSYSTVVDRWHFYGHNCSGLEWTIERGTRTDGRRTFKATTETSYSSLAALSLFIFAQEIEATMTGGLEKGTPRAKDATISFDFKSSITGTYICEVKDDQNSWSISIPFTVTTADTWESFELLVPKETTQVTTLTPGDLGLRVGFAVLAGSSYQSGGSLQDTWAADTVNKRFYGQVNLANGAGNVFEISDVQFEIGAEKSDYDRVPHDDELFLVRRFSEFRSSNYLTAFCTVEGDVANGAGMIFFDRSYAVRKRNEPSNVTYDSATITGPTVYPLGTLNLTTGSLANLDFPTFNMTTTDNDPNITQGLAYPAFLGDIHYDSEFYMTW